jgi:hypothetical protein
MSSKRWIYLILLEFVLPIALLGVTFWAIGGFIQNQIFNQMRWVQSWNSLQLSPNVEIPVHSILIRADIDLKQNRATVNVFQLDRGEPLLNLEFLTVKPNQLEPQIAETLGISVKEVRDRIRYRVHGVHQRRSPHP